MLSTGDIVLIVANIALDDGDESDEAMGDLILVTKRPLLYQINVFAMSLSLLSFFQNELLVPSPKSERRMFESQIFPDIRIPEVMPILFI